MLCCPSPTPLKPSQHPSKKEPGRNPVPVLMESRNRELFCYWKAIATERKHLYESVLFFPAGFLTPATPPTPPTPSTLPTAPATYVTRRRCSCFLCSFLPHPHPLTCLQSTFRIHENPRESSRILKNPPPPPRPTEESTTEELEQSTILIPGIPGSGNVGIEWGESLRVIAASWTS